MLKALTKQSKKTISIKRLSRLLSKYHQQHGWILSPPKYNFLHKRQCKTHCKYQLNNDFNI